jgi:chromosome segregation ATPase
MKPTIINHPFHVIKLEYNSEAPLSALEQEAIEKYVELHNQSQEYNQVLTRLLTYYTSATKILQQCKVIFDNLQNEYILLTPMLHYLQEGGPLTENEIESIDESERVCYDTQPLLTQLHSFNHTFDAYADGLMAAEKEFSATEQQQEKLELQFDDFNDNYFNPIIRDYQIMEIDICSLDENFDDFRGAFSELYKQVDNLIDIRNAFLDQHIKLQNRIIELDKDIVALFAAINGDTSSNPN